MHLLFVSTRRSKPSFRFRVEQILPFFQARRHTYDVALVSSNTWSRLALYRRMANYDAVVIQKRLFSRGELFMIRRRARRLVYDVDDAVMFNGRGEDDKRRRSRFQAMMQAADLVVCGNEYLAAEASRDSRSVIVIPTCIDTELYHPRLRSVAAEGNVPGPVTVGWTGSRSTNRYLSGLVPVLSPLGDRIRLKVVSDTPEGLDFHALSPVPHEFVPWSAETEVSETATFDIGLMPLPDDPWTRGKCGFKALQYMALAIPAVCSPVGVNCRIIQHGETGFLADGPETWSRILDQLIGNASLRSRIGRAGRQRVEKAYALAVHGPRLVSAVERVLPSARRSA